MRFLLLHTPDWDPAPLAQALTGEGIEVREVAGATALERLDRPTAVVLGPEAMVRTSADDLAAVWRLGAAPVGLGPPDGGIPSGTPAERLSAHLPADAAPARFLIALRTALRESATRRRVAAAERELTARATELSELTAIGIQLSVERDYATLLDMILRYARRITQSDAGSLYLVSQSMDGPGQLQFKLTQNDTLPDLDFEEASMPLDHSSVAGHVAVEAVPLVIEDVYQLTDGVPYGFNRSFDEHHGYRTRSMLVLPMTNHQAEVIGVLQLINHKRDPGATLSSHADVDRVVGGYSTRLVDLARAMASLAGVALENSQLYDEIERLFDGFVRASVTAIEARDPVTSGHSERVAVMTERLATVASDCRTGPFRDLRLGRDDLRELRYAALLHDFGKVGVREEVLGKEKKLYEADLAEVKQRHAFLVRTAQWQFEKARASHLEKYGTQGYDQMLQALRAAEAQEFERLDRFLNAVLTANEPTVVEETVDEALEEFAGESFRALDGEAAPILSQDDLRRLRIRRGTLDEAERRELEDHVRHTYAFLRQIPWTAELVRVPAIAFGHHEKLDGSGYPRGVTATDIPIQTRIMTLADIYDALTAMDRPYKPALTAVRALDVMRTDVEAGSLDPALFELFVQARVYDASAAA
jgi:HD-GYP domain-containing protein (c-di-GMP phosphodiesterase class II)